MYQQSGQWPMGMGGMGQMGQIGGMSGGMGGGGMNMGMGGMGMGNPFAINQQQQQQGPGLSPGSMGGGGAGGRGSASAFTDQQGNELKPFDSGEMKKGRLGHYGYLDGRGEFHSSLGLEIDYLHQNRTRWTTSRVSPRRSPEPRSFPRSSSEQEPHLAQPRPG